tara:strand:- start:764 stop:934 length:171 start_codon:yes stop_codon:yes gene_type:complete
MNKEILNLFTSSETKAQVLVIVGVIWLLPIIIGYFLAILLFIRPINYLIGLRNKWR